MAVTATMREKWMNIVELVDADNDEIVTVEEMYAIGQKLVDYYHVKGDPVNDLMRYGQLLVDIMKAYYGSDSTKTSLTPQEFVEVNEWYWNNHLDRFTRKLRRFFAAVFHAMDLDQDGWVSRTEFQFSYKGFGESASIQEKARRAFNALDANKDEKISKAEYIDGFMKYYLDPDVTAEELPLY